MQKLDYRDMKERAIHKDYPIPSETVGIKIAVEDNESGVTLVINNTKRIYLSLQGARDLALAMRQSANRVSKGKPGKEKRK